LGPNNPRISVYASALANACLVQGKHLEAKEFYERCVKIDDQLLPPGHPIQLQHLHEYANLLHKMGRSEEAQRVEERASVLRSGKPK